MHLKLIGKIHVSLSNNVLNVIHVNAPTTFSPKKEEINKRMNK